MHDGDSCFHMPAGLGPGEYVGVLHIKSGAGGRSDTWEPLPSYAVEPNGFGGLHSVFAIE